jgi:histidyl-tRNA synthetase
LFNRFLSHIGLKTQSVEVLRTVDKLAKIGLDETKQGLAEFAGTHNAQKILDFTGAGTHTENFDETLNRITELSGGPCPESERLSLIRRFMNDLNDGDFFTLDPSITRGLDYYTGVVFETFLTALPDIGSICSGGRYDNLAGLYSKNSISGVGSSIGLDRMITALESLGSLPASSAYTSAAIACVKQEDGGRYQALAQQFRQAGIPCEVFLESALGGTDNKHLVKQYVLAEKKGLRWMIIPGDDPLNSPLTLRDLTTRKNHEGLSVTEAVRIMGN